MKRRHFLFGLTASALLATPVMAEGVVESIVRQLKTLGFRSIVQERTLLGRVRIVAGRADGQREIIVNPRTGEILRDLWTPAGGNVGSAAIIDDRGGNSGGASGGDQGDDDHDDKEEEDEKEGDNSGSGSDDGGGSGKD